MSHKPFDKREVENVTPELMREELDKYFAHVQEHDPKSLEFALMVTGHGEEGGGTHVCSMVGGPPQAIAQVLVELMDELMENNPAFAAFFILSFMRRMHGRQDTGGPDVEAQVKDMLDKLRGNTPPDGSIH